MKIILYLSLCIPLLACSTRDVYTAVQESKRVECQKYPDTRYEQCMEQLETSYDEYSEQLPEAKRQ